MSIMNHISDIRNATIAKAVIVVFHIYIDIAVEGVSLLATKRADFKSLIAEGGIDGLIKTLEDLNKIPDPEVAGSKQ